MFNLGPHQQQQPPMQRGNDMFNQQSGNQMAANAPVGAMHAGPNSHSSSMNVIVNQPAAGGAGAAGGRKPMRWLHKGREWNAHLCGCFADIGTCAMVTFCTTCTMCYLNSQMKENCIGPILVPHNLPALRLKLRSFEHIEGSIFCDCCMSYCFPLCVMCQIKREIDIITKGMTGPLHAG